MPEIHGCGEEARKASREKFLKQNTPNNHKPLDDTKRKLVQNKLRSKVCFIYFIILLILIIINYYLDC